MKNKPFILFKKLISRQLFLMLVVTGLLISSSCEKPEDNKDDEDYEKEQVSLKIVWQNVVYNDSAFAGFFPAQFTGDYVVFCSGGQYEVNPGFAVYHKETGERHPAWDHEPDFDFLVHDQIMDFGICGTNNDVLFMQPSSYDERVIAWDLNTGNKLWEKDLNDADYLYYSSSYGSNIFLSRTDKNNTWEELIALDAKTGTEKIILHEEVADDYEDFFLPAATTLPNGDTLLVFSRRKNTGAESFVYAFNLTADSIVWKADNISGAIPANEGIIADGYFLFHGYRNISCFDIQTGDFLWTEKPIANANDYITERRSLYAQGKWFVNNNYGELFCYDVSSGNLLWENKDSQLHTWFNSIIGYYNDRIYLNARFNSSLPEKYRNSLRCISANTGEVLWTTNGPGKYSNVGQGLNIDEKTGYLYITNGISAFCYDLNHDPLSGN